VIRSQDKQVDLANLLDINPNMQDFANKLISNSETGVNSVKIDVDTLKPDVNIDKEVYELISARLNDSEQVTIQENISGEGISIVKEDGVLKRKKLFTSHFMASGEEIKFPIGAESDGTKRLLYYVPILYGIIFGNKVVAVDEIDRSVHGLLIKEIIAKLSREKKLNGQLIFTTHESGLLDQSILRRDEIWFAQKDLTEGSTKLYPLSDYKVHHTANIENGYLNGRYGGIPFLSNLHDLHWNNE